MPIELGPEPVTDRRRRRAAFLRDLAEARALRERLAPRRTRLARKRAVVHMRTVRL